MEVVGRFRVFQCKKGCFSAWVSRKTIKPLPRCQGFGQGNLGSPRQAHSIFPRSPNRRFWRKKHLHTRGRHFRKASRFGVLLLCFLRAYNCDRLGNIAMLSDAVDLVIPRLEVKEDGGTELRSGMMRALSVESETVWVGQRKVKITFKKMAQTVSSAPRPLR